MDRRVKSCCLGLLEVREISRSVGPTRAQANGVLSLLSREERELTDPSPPSPPNNIFTVQLLHQTVKEFLQDSAIFDHLFVGKQVRPSENGHTYILRYCLRLLKASEYESVPHGVSSVGREILLHAPYADKMQSSSNTELFDALDRQMSRCTCMFPTYNEAWPGRVAFKRSGTQHYTFLAFAVESNMLRYVSERLNVDRRLVNAKTGMPLLHYAVGDPHSSCLPDMVRLLLEHGANVGKSFGGALAIHSVRHAKFREKAAWEKVLRLLLNHGANPNSKFETVYAFYPLPNLVAQLDGPEDFKLDLLKILRHYGADLRRTDSLGRSVLSYASSSYEFFGGLRWLLENRAKISKEMVERDGFFISPSVYSDPFFRGPQFCEPEAQQAANPFFAGHPAWDMITAAQEKPIPVLDATKRCMIM